jgi:hypothetical protein
MDLLRMVKVGSCWPKPPSTIRCWRGHCRDDGGATVVHFGRFKSSIQHDGFHVRHVVE